MELKAIQKAGYRFEAAQTQLRRCEETQSYDAFVAEWHLFLVAAKGVQILLGKGCRSDPHSRRWWDKEKFEEIQSDPLLCYFDKARNDDEHGLEFVTVKGTVVSIPSDRTKYARHPKYGYLLAGFEITPDLERNAFAKLTSVSGLKGQVYPVPTSHRGKPIADQSPIAMGKLLLSYLEELMIEAGKRVA